MYVSSSCRQKSCYYFLFKFVSTDISDPCSSRPCLNSGICSSVGTSQFKCFCSPGYTGTHCEHAQGSLSQITKPLRNLYQKLNQLHTISSISFIIILDPCISNPCLNGGICFKLADLPSFGCACPEKFTGSLCETGI